MRYNTYPGGDTTYAHAEGGMTLRDWFAGQALAGHCANPNLADASAKQIATLSIESADAMIAARANQPAPGEGRAK